MWSDKQMNLKPAVSPTITATVALILLVVGAQSALGTISIQLGKGADSIGTESNKKMYGKIRKT